jgi:hypothetical protein
MGEYKWHKLSEETPQREGNYLVCDNAGHIAIRKWRSEISYYESFSSSNKTIKPARFVKTTGTTAENVYFWTELPEAPDGLSERALREEVLMRQIQKLKKQIAELRAEATTGGGADE